MVSTVTIRALPFPVLIGDIGGTNARFAIVPDKDAPIEVFKSVATADFPDIESAVATSVFPRTELRPKSAVIDLAGPISGDEVPLTNALWVMRPRQMMARMGVIDVVLLNDFEALALALTALDRDDMVAIGGGAPTETGAKVVLGPGTGLGVGALVRAGNLWAPVPGEGGHVSLGPAEADEFPVWANIEPEHGRISAEAILCGRGLVRLYDAIAKTAAHQPRFGTPEEITKAALDASDADAVRTVSLWVRLLGRVAGDMALIFMARGGAYIAGGIPPRVVEFFRQPDFRRAFEEKAPHQAAMASMPTFVVVGENPALKGLAAFARGPERFGVNLVGRRWTA